MRAVTADQERFSEAINAYRPSTDWWPPYDTGPKRTKTGRAYLLGSVALTETVVTAKFSALPTYEVVLFRARSAFVTPINVDVRADDMYPDEAHYKGQAVAALMSVAYDRPFISPRDPQRAGLDPSQEDLHDFALQHNVLVAGPGAHHTRLDLANQARLGERLKDLVLGLDRLDDATYTKVMQAIRLHHLALSFRRSDFDLGFALLVASIEAMAQVAFGSGRLVEPEYSEMELLLKNFCEAQGSKQLKEWFNDKVRRQARLKKKFLEYIFRFAPVERWSETRHPLGDMVDYLATVSPGVDRSWITESRWNEIAPEQVTPQMLGTIIGAAYDDRSGFLHSGSKSRHTSPDRPERYFEVVESSNFKSGTITRVVVPKFETMSTIARVALLNYLSGA